MAILVAVLKHMPLSEFRHYLCNARIRTLFKKRLRVALERQAREGFHNINVAAAVNLVLTRSKL